jgi:hypothetical protein
MEHRAIPNLLLIGLMVTGILLAGFTLAPASIGSSHISGSQSNSPTTLQITTLLNKETSRNQVASGKSPLSPDATVGETAAMMASEILLLNMSTYNVEMPLITK